MYSVHQWSSTFLTHDPFFTFYATYISFVGHEKEKK